MQFKKPLIAAAALAVVGAGALGIGTTFAAESTDGRTNRLDTIVSAIAERFSLDEDDVRAVFEEQRATAEAAHEARADEHLADLVEDGTLTQEQADALREKREALHTLMESLKDATPEERKEAMDAQRDEMHAWAEEQGIDLKEVMPRPHHGPRGGFPQNGDAPIEE